MASYDDTIVDGLGLHPAPGVPPTGYGVVNADVLKAHDALGSVGYGVTKTMGMGFHEAQFFYAFQAGAGVIEGLGFDDSVSQAATYGQIVDDALSWADDQLCIARGQSLTSGIGLHLAQSLARTITVLDKLHIHDIPLTNSFSNIALFEGLAFDDSIVDFFGLGHTNNFTFHDAFTPTFQFNKTVSDGVGFHPALLANLLFMRVVDDDIGLDDADIVNMIYQGDTLADGFQISIGTVDPGGGFTTWAINTRTSSVTEYQNYVFNSFAQIGNELYGASDDGLYLLNNQTDNGVNIGTDIKGALLALGGSRFTQLDGVYLGIRVNDNAREFVLKLITPGGLEGGKTFIYSFTPKNMQTTRVNIGKGFRSRYMQWELITPGPDFDLDSLEFVPLISKRRV